MLLPHIFKKVSPCVLVEQLAEVPAADPSRPLDAVPAWARTVSVGSWLHHYSTLYPLTAPTVIPFMMDFYHAVRGDITQQRPWPCP